MAKKTAEQIVQKYQEGVARSGNAYAAGVQNPSRPWAASTAAAEGRWRNGIQQAIQNGSFARGVQKAGDAKWAQAAAGRGAANYAAAAPHAAQAYASRAGEIMGAANAAAQAANSIPGDTMEQRLQRALAAMKATSEYWKNR